MDEGLAALGRNVGKVDTDSNGLARYSLKLQLPPAIRHDIEPELSLEYCQGTPNGSLGVGWALGGLSCIRRAPSSLAYDGANPGPANYDRSQSKLNLDGAELLNIEGDYGAPNAKYMTEVDDKGRTITPFGTGFLSTDSHGFRAEYGTSDDSRVVGSDASSTREWRLKTSSDYHGNTVIYTYAINPQASGSKTDENTSYISSIRYTSNRKTGLEGKRLIKFEYGSRPDIIVQCTQGVRCKWASLLKGIHLGILQGENFILNRSYELDYTASTASGDSFIRSITETSFQDGRKIKLLPSVFDYSTSGVLRENVFRTSGEALNRLPSTTNNVTLFSMNISGRCLADLACVRFNPSTNQLSLKTYLANVNADGSIRWVESKTPVGEAKLPYIKREAGFPSILCPDLTNDGRADFVVPYQNSDNFLAFSVSQSAGTGFQSARISTTKTRWIDGTKFMAIDNPGRSPSIVQIFTDQNELTFRNFPVIVNDGKAELQDPVMSRTAYKNSGTIDWIQLSHTATGAKSLVRVWEENKGMGNSQIKATTFAMNKDNSLKETRTSSLGSSVGTTKSKRSVLSCDINADGTQDIVLATADFIDDQITLTYSTYLGDGLGGFSKYGETVTRKSNSDTPQTATDFGEFHVTNLNGTNYPSLSFVYQTKYSKSYVCITVDGCCDGSIGKTSVYKLAEKLAFEKTQILATDLNGNGLGDWLFYTLEQDIPRLIPVYNHSQCADLLSSALDSIGLRTELTYGCLSDTKVYEAGVKWEDYNNDRKDSYPVVAAPNYVVTQLQHRNEASINSFEYHVTIKKTYAKARINHLGRGWQGFSEINTLNDTDGILTTETYLQDWPLSGAKTQIDTKTPDGNILKSTIVKYQKGSKSKGPWQIYRTDRMQEETIMMESGAPVRSMKTLYTYDTDGNMILRSPSETQRGQLMFQSWDRCSYTTIDGVSGVLTAQKTSADERNLDMTKFEPGDTSLVIYENETSRAVLKSIATWSTDTQEFSKQYITIDEYGRESKKLSAAGLQRTTTYDETFQTFPIKVTEVGNGVSTTQLTAFDTQSGIESARLETTGLLTCYRLDGFGRTLGTYIRAQSQGQNTVRGNEVLQNNPYVASSDLIDLLGRTHFNTQRRISFDRFTSTNGSAHVVARVVTCSKEGTDGENELCEFVNCVKEVRKRSSRNGGSNEKVWMYMEYNSQGAPVYESYPVKLPSAIGPDWSPDKEAGVRSTMDILNRPIMRVKPAHGGKKGYIISASTYLDGGARVRERTLTADRPDLNNATLLTQIERRYIQMEKESLVIENINENGMSSQFEYDIHGRLIKCIDPAKQVESRSYSSQGPIVSMDNPYQNVAQASGTLASKMVYDAAGHLIRETNAVGETVTYERDAKGRTLTKTGQDGRTLKCVYDQEGIESLSSITIFPKGTNNPFESRSEFIYDYCGRVKERKTTLMDGRSYKISMDFDWQGQISQKTLPNGVVLTNSYRGSDFVSSILSSGPTTNWTFSAEITNYSSFGRPEALRMQVSGIKDTFTHNWQYDAQGFPTAHRLDNQSKTLVDERYLYNDVDQLELKQDFLSGESTSYKYQGKRLHSSQLGSRPVNIYGYDAAGNLTKNRDMTLSYGNGQAKGTRDGISIVDATYDQAGRLKQRTTSDATLSLSYDSFGALSTILDLKTGQKVNMINDHNGEMLLRTESDGSSDLYLSNDVSIHIQPDGSQLVRYHVFNGNQTDGTSHQIATVSMSYESKDSSRPLPTRRLDLPFTDTKGNVTHIFNAEDSSLRRKLDYDDFGLLDTKRLDEDDIQSTYEGNFLDKLSGLVNFGARWYDPLVGRFTSPDDILDAASLLLTDGLNRYAFENNDPINHIDPTGHMSWSGVLGIVVSCYLIYVAIGITIATGGAAAPLAAAAVGALMSGGVAGLMYSLDHKDEEDAGKFWGGFGMTVGINAAIGAATGALGAVASPARMASAAARIAIKALAGGVASVLTKAAERGVENKFYGKHHDLWEGWAGTFMVGAFIGGAMAAKGGSSKDAGLRGAMDPKTYNVWMNQATDPSLGKAFLGLGVKYGGKLALYCSDRGGLNDVLQGSKEMFISDMKTVAGAFKSVMGRDANFPDIGPGRTGKW